MTTPDLSRAVRPRTSASLRAQGVSKHVLDGPAWRRSTPGRYVPTAVPRTTVQRLAEAAAHLPSGAALAGWAAAYVLGASSFDGIDALGRLLPVTMSVPDGLHRKSSAGLRYVRRDLGDDDVVHVDGLPVTSPLRTGADLARWAPTLEDAVVRLDLLLDAGILRGTDLPSCIARLGGGRGSRQARTALGLARAGSRSPGETRLRLVYVLDTGAPDPLLHPTVLDDGGHLLGIPDLLDVEAGLALEYDGARWSDPARPDGHLDPAQQREDNVRQEGFERHGLLVVRAAKTDLGRHRRQLALRLQAARADGLRRGASAWRWQVAPDRHLFPVRRAR